MEYEDLMELAKNERENSALSKVQPNLYIQMVELEERKRERALEGDLLFVKEYENVKKTIEKVKELRLAKITYFASRGIDPGNLTDEERELFLHVKAGVGRFLKKEAEKAKEKTGLAEMEKKAEQQIEDILKKEAEFSKKEEQGQKANSAEKENPGFEKIKIVRYVDAYRSVDGKVYGPYRPEELVEIKKEEAEWLIASGYAKNL